MEAKQFTNNELMEKLKEVEGLVRDMFKTVLRQKMNNKQELVAIEVMKRRIMDTNQVIRFIGVSRTYALSLMQRVAEQQEGYIYRRGSKKNRIASKLIYNEDSIIQEHNEKILQRFKEFDTVTVGDVVGLFGGIDQQEAKRIAIQFANKHNGYTFIENKLIKSG